MLGEQVQDMQTQSSAKVVFERMIQAVNVIPSWRSFLRMK